MLLIDGEVLDLVLEIVNFILMDIGILLDFEERFRFECALLGIA
jgi:hypothetical protein